MPKYRDSDLDKIFEDIYKRIEKLEAKMDTIVIGLKSISDLLKRKDQ